MEMALGRFPFGQAQLPFFELLQLIVNGMPQQPLLASCFGILGAGACLRRLPQPRTPRHLKARTNASTRACTQSPTSSHTHPLQPTEEPPELPDTFSEELRSFVHACLAKDPQKRPSPAQLLQHPWLEKRCTRQEMAAWVKKTLAAK